ncbi:MAG: NAD(P)H-dependent oxidoreductase subunit E [Mycoplasmoidaceae bacterium]
MTIEEFAARIKQIHSKNGTKLMCLQEAQANFGYLSREAMRMIADEFNTTTSEIYSIATFYTQFTFTKKGKYVITVCLGTACYVKGSAKVLEKFEQILGIKLGETTEDGMFTLASARCVGCCGLAPVTMINDKVYTILPDQVQETIDLILKHDRENGGNA